LQYRLTTEIWAKYAALAVNDPVTMTMAGLAVAGGGLTAAGTIAGGNSAAALGRAQQGEASFEATEARYNAGADVAAAQRRAWETNQNTSLLVSKARATGAAGGVNVGAGSSVENQGDITQRGRYAAALDLWNGKNAATADLNKAAGLDYTGFVDVIGGRMAQQGADLSAAGGLMTTIAGAGSTAYSLNNPKATPAASPFPAGGAAPYPMYSG
jgi:hypothetical protein